MKKIKSAKKSSKVKFIKSFITSIQSYFQGKRKITGLSQLFFVVTILLTVFLIVGCVTLAPKAIGPQFSPKEATSENKATVYVYNPHTIGAMGVTKGSYLWYGKPISPEEALEANEGIILLYPGWVEQYSKSYYGTYEKTGRWVKSARYYDLDINVNDQDEQENSQKTIEYNVIDKFVGGGRTHFVNVEIMEILENDIALAKEDPENYLMNAQLAPYTILSKAYFKLTLKPGETNFWLSNNQPLHGQLRPYVYPDKMLTIDLKPGRKYFIMLIRFDGFKLNLVPETIAKSLENKSILDCRRSHVKSDN